MSNKKIAKRNEGKNKDHNLMFPKS
jgi:hypothetical protein